MNLLFTGASSFTGFWFAKTLASAGHRVFCTLTKASPGGYEGLRRERVDLLLKQKNIIPLWKCEIANAPDVFPADETLHGFCSHAAEVGDYKNADFNPLQAVAKNTLGIKNLYRWLRKKSCAFVLHSGTYFEAGEGVPDTAGNPSFSPYSVSKTMTWELVRFYANQNNLCAAKFVMSNPFGAYEERGFVGYLIKTWLRGETPSVNTPDYIRDNIPVSLMAQKYAAGVVVAGGNTRLPVVKFAPSGFVGTQGNFAHLLAARMEKLLKKKCPLTIAEKMNVVEPLERKNSESGIEDSPALDVFWQELSDFYTAHPQ
jgi:nucleoside-diphosphate-sugar epimerase